MFSLSRVAAPIVQLASGHVAAAAAATAAAAAAPGGAAQYSTALALNNIKPGVVGGPGNRSSVSGGVATVFGATGFLGKYVVNELARHGTQVICPYRCVEERASPLKQMGDLGQVVLLRDWHLNNDAATVRAMSRSNIVINLIGANLETRNFSFEDVHEAWPGRLAALAAEAGVERLIHLSDMGAAPDHPSRRMRSKAAGDSKLREAFPSATIIKPAPLVGDEDDFLNNLLFQVKFNASVWLVDDGAFSSPPTHVTDVARAVASVLHQRDTPGNTYYLGGPETLSIRDLVELIQSSLHIMEDTTTYIPAALAKLAYAPGDALRRKLPPMPGRNYMYTGDYVDEMSRNKAPPEGALGYADLGIVPAKITEGMAIEPIRYQRVGGYSYGDTKALAKSLPANVKRFFGMQSPN